MITVACVLVLAAPAPGAGLGKRNSIKVEFLSIKPFDIAGTGCGSTAAGSVTLAAPPKGVSKAFAFKIVKPKVGDRDGYVRVTAVQVFDQTITVTAVADAAECPAQASGPPAQEPWSARFAPDISFTRRVQARLRPDADKKRPKLAPRSMRLFSGDTLRRIRWKGFGGKSATGTARYRVHIPGQRCTPKICLGHNGRVKIRLRRVRRCGPYGLWEYTRLAVIFRGRMLFETGNIC